MNITTPAFLLHMKCSPKVKRRRSGHKPNDVYLLTNMTLQTIHFMVSMCNLIFLVYFAYCFTYPIIVSLQCIKTHSIDIQCHSFKQRWRKASLSPEQSDSGAVGMNV